MEIRMDDPVWRRLNPMKGNFLNFFVLVAVRISVGCYRKLLQAHIHLTVLVPKVC